MVKSGLKPGNVWRTMNRIPTGIHLARHLAGNSPLTINDGWCNGSTLGPGPSSESSSLSLSAMKKYLLFAGAYYYPGGGVQDLIGNFDTIEEAKERVNHAVAHNENADWATIVEHATMDTIAWYEAPHDVTNTQLTEEYKTRYIEENETQRGWFPK